MRFFKAFNLLHRRTKSTTFVPGLQAALHTNVRTSSSSPDTNSILFDLVISKPPPIPATFNHIDVKSNEPDRMLGLWRPRRYSDRNSNSNSLQPSIKKESVRLTEAVNFWIQEYSKIQDLLKSCHAELVAERLKSAALERKIDADRQEILDLQCSLACPENLAGKSRDNKGLEDDPPQTRQIILHPGTRLATVPPATDFQVIFGASVKPRTLDEYSSALRMTITTRKALRDQKKITKYWKNLVVIGEQQSTVTPSVSTISSIRETLPADRQVAVEALMARRGFATRLKRLQSEDGFPEIPSSTPIELSDTQTAVLPDALATLPLSCLSSDLSSRLDPLASESMKQEVHFLYGSHSSSKRLSPSRSRQSGSLEVSKSTSVRGELSKNTKHSLSIDSFGDLNAIFQRAFGIEHVSKHENAGQISLERSNTLVAFQLSSSFPQNVVVSPSPYSSIPSELSQTWVNIESVDHENTVLEPFSATAPQAQSLKQAGKECTSRRSWQKYVAQSTTPNRNSGGEKLPRKAAGGKENNRFSMSMPVFKRSNSRLPVPTFGRKES